MSYDYSTYVAQLSNLMVVPSSDSNFQTFLPGCIDYAEQRLYRELDLLSARDDETTTISSGSRTVAIPTPTSSMGGTAFIVVDQINIFTGSRKNTLAFTSPDFIDAVYSDTGVVGTPMFAARVDESNFMVGPVPDVAYSLEFRGTIRPTALSSSNTSTFLTTQLPDLFMAASMVFASAYMRDFGGQSDNPSQAQSWESQYKTLFESANVEEVRKVYQSQGWTSQQPSPLASPPRV